jgi:hypothetical protein
MRMRSLLAVPMLAAAAALTAGTVSGATGGGCSSGTTIKTDSYIFALSIGPVEAMYTPAQVAAKHPMTGEVMLSGSMTAMTMSSSERHLEVHICTTGGTVITNAHPTISVTDAKMGMPTKVPVVVMQGVTAGKSDLHYGNNVALTAGEKIAVKVTLKGQSAVFHTTVAKAHSAMAMG